MIPFKPAPFIKNGHLQTLYPALFSKPSKPKIEIEIFELSDGDFVECIWSKKPKNKEPITILFHGLAGSFHSPYIKRAINTIDGAIVLMHFRGCGKDINRLPRSYHSGETGDAKEFISSLKKRYPTSILRCIGYSLGGNMLLKLLGEYGDNSPITKAISISAPMQLESSANTINKGFSKLYQYRLMSSLKDQLKHKYLQHDMKELIGLDLDDADKLKTFWEFDDAYTAPVHGFKDVYDYYKRSSAKQYLKYIKTDTLIIHSLDDPFMNDEVIPTKNELSDKIKLEIYPNGGHVGFVSGTVFKPIYWLEDRIMEFL